VNLTSAIWFTVVTMTTVGYGDYFPKTLPGRALVIFLCIWGIFLVSLIVVTLTNMVTLNNAEFKGMNIFLKL
jgi:voltage-gated potassium channel Kch